MQHRRAAARTGHKAPAPRRSDGLPRTRDAGAPAPATLSAADAERIAKTDAGIPNATVLSTKLVAVPTADQGARSAYQVTLGDGLTSADPVAFTTHVDARDGSVLVRQNIVDSHSDNPEWDVFPNSPSTTYSSADTRRTWCWKAQRGCDEVVGNPASPRPWDVDLATGERLERHGAHEFQGRARQDHVHFRAGLCEQSRQPRGLVAGDPSRDAEEDPALIERTDRPTPRDGAGRRGIRRRHPSRRRAR